MINAIGNYVQDDINQKQARQNQINQQMNAVIMSRQTRPFQNIQQFQRTPSAQYPQPVPTQQVQQPMYQPAPIKWNSGY